MGNSKGKQHRSALFLPPVHGFFDFAFTMFWDNCSTNRTAPRICTAHDVRIIGFIAKFIKCDPYTIIFIDTVIETMLSTLSIKYFRAESSSLNRSLIAWKPCCVRMAELSVVLPRGLTFPFPSVTNFRRGSSPHRSVGRSFPPPPPRVELPLWNSIDWSYNVISYVLGRTNRIQSPKNGNSWGFTYSCFNFSDAIPKPSESIFVKTLFLSTPFSISE